MRYLIAAVLCLCAGICEAEDASDAFFKGLKNLLFSAKPNPEDGRPNQNTEQIPVGPPEAFKQLTVSQARAGIEMFNQQAQDTLNLSGLASLEPDVARELAKYKGVRSFMGHRFETTDASLLLNGLTSIDSDVARELANVRTGLHLDGLTSIDSDVARELAKKPGMALSLKGLETIEPSVARELARFRGLLYLRMSTVDIDVAEQLARFEGKRLRIYLTSARPLNEGVCQYLKPNKNVEIVQGGYLLWGRGVENGYTMGDRVRDR